MIMLSNNIPSQDIGLKREALTTVREQNGVVWTKYRVKKYPDQKFPVAGQRRKRMRGMIDHTFYITNGYFYLFHFLQL